MFEKFRFLIILITVVSTKAEKDLGLEFQQFNFTYNLDEEIIRNKAPPGTEELARQAGYQLKFYRTTTEDGYNLVIHRLLPQSGVNESRPVVLLQHGIAQSSADWLINYSGKSFAMYLVDLGYDVFLGNARGNKYSNSHVKHKTNTMEFFDFTFHESGLYDFPKTVDLVLKETGKEKINYIGCSIGATIFFVGMSQRPEYASRIHFMGAISPLAFLTHTKSPIKILTPHINEIREAADSLQVMRLNPETIPNLINSQLGKLCFFFQLSRGLCSSINKMLDEFGLRRIEEEHLDDLWKYVPTTTSAKTFIHLLQLMNNHEEIFDEYDFGPNENPKRYGSHAPPEYELSNVQVPVAIFSGKNELFSTSEDTEALRKALPLVVRHTEVDANFKVHTDFTHEAEAVEKVFKPMIFILNFFNKRSTN